MDKSIPWVRCIVGGIVIWILWLMYVPDLEEGFDYTLNYLQGDVEGIERKGLCQHRRGRKIMEKDIKEMMQYYERFIDIVKQISMNAKEQIAKLKGTVVADELASNFSEIGMMYAKELLENDWITQEQYSMVKSIDEMLVNISKRNELWSEDALLNAEEWEECRKKGRLLLEVCSNE